MIGNQGLTIRRYQRCYTTTRGAIKLIYCRLEHSRIPRRRIGATAYGYTCPFVYQGNYPERFCVTSGVKQGCVIAPILLTLSFAATFGEALPGSAEVILIRFRTGGGIFNIRRLQAKTKVYL